MAFFYVCGGRVLPYFTNSSASSKQIPFLDDLFFLLKIFYPVANSSPCWFLDHWFSFPSIHTKDGACGSSVLLCACTASPGSGAEGVAVTVLPALGKIAQGFESRLWAQYKGDCAVVLEPVIIFSQGYLSKLICPFIAENLVLKESCITPSYLARGIAS